MPGFPGISYFYQLLKYMLLRPLGIALSSLLLVASPVNADWEFTRWGMSIKELKRVSPNKIIDNETTCVSEDKQKKELRSLWTGYGTTFDVCFIFVNQKLSQIYLFPKEETNLLPVLMEKYGESNIAYKSSAIFEYYLREPTKNTTIIWQYENEEIVFLKDESNGESREAISIGPSLGKPKL